ncbi:MAG: bifunctional protein tyrosine phosphatase family protein/NAD(P)/FAD-dependent oxidoreductase, partial [Gammaproteobacteria bacterium]|nr:bifunctional protein tyrosine phosphatase family protein/NAD(P)/FAD-dependent oxidoreductase [Gammaproteobacteria bacterium]
IEKEAQKHGLSFTYLPVISGNITDKDIDDFASMYSDLIKPVHAYCRSGMRSTMLWALSSVKGGEDPEESFNTAKKAGFDLSSLSARLVSSQPDSQKTQAPKSSWDVLIVGGGAAGISSAASLLSRNTHLSIAIIDPSDVHYYQPGWTLVGAGVFTQEKTKRAMASLMPSGVKWIQAAVAGFDPARNVVVLEGCEEIAYKRMIVAPGIMLNWKGIEGLSESLGKNGVTSNYRYDLAPYTWELVQKLNNGRALFTQPPMPIKCAGAPQKAMYLSGDYWFKNNRLAGIDIEFYNAGGALFGVKEYIPALMEYVDRYKADLKFMHNLVRVSGEEKLAWFEKTDSEGNKEVVETTFDMIHVCPPQKAPLFISNSPLADQGGWVDVDKNNLRHKTYDNIWSLGDVTNTPNAKTAAAARTQAPIVAANIIADINTSGEEAHYNGYGSCPLTVERGKVVLAEFGYGGKLLPSFPKWLLDGTQPTRAAWFLKETMLPPIYWEAMLKGKEWMVKAEIQRSK